MVGGFVLVPRGARAATVVPGGTIAVDTTWTKAGAPYLVQGDVVVLDPAVLTVEAGVTVIFEGNHSLLGAVRPIGTVASPVRFEPLASPTIPYQWGPLGIASGQHFRVLGVSGVELLGGSVAGCAVSAAVFGFHIGPYERVRVADCSFTNILNEALILEGTGESVFANLTIDRAGTGLSLEHFGPPESVGDPVHNLFSHLAVSNASAGVQSAAVSATTAANVLAYSLVRDVGTALPQPFAGVVHHNAFLRNAQDLGGTGHLPGNYDDGAAGNFWDRYTGVDGNGDGIGDIPYGPDRYPLAASPPTVGPYAAPPPGPRLASADPGPGARNVSTHAVLRFTFTRPMATSFPPWKTFDASGPIANGVATWADPRTLQITPGPGPLLRDTTYVVTVHGSIVSLDGVPLGADVAIAFATLPDVRVVSSDPAAGNNRVRADAVIVIRFSVSMDEVSVARALRVEPHLHYDLNWSAPGDAVSIVPRAPLEPGTWYTVSVAGSAMDRDGGTLAAYELRFHTEVPTQDRSQDVAFVAVLVIAIVAATVLLYFAFRKKGGR